MTTNKRSSQKTFLLYISPKSTCCHQVLNERLRAAFVRPYEEEVLTYIHVHVYNLNQNCCLQKSDNNTIYEPIPVNDGVHDVGALDRQCHYCGAWFFEDEKNKDGSYNKCCRKGKFFMPAFKNAHPLLRNLMTGEHALSKHFMDNIRVYNSTLSFTSMGADQVQFGNNGPYTYVVHGMMYCETMNKYWKYFLGNVYHRLHTSLTRDDGNQPTFMQVHYLDNKMQTNARHSTRPNQLNQGLLHTLGNIVQEHPYSRVLRNNKQSLNNCDMYGICIKADTSLDMRRSNTYQIQTVYMMYNYRYNAPTQESDFAVLIRGHGDEKKKPRDIVLRHKAGHMMCISTAHTAYDCLHYVLTHCNGELGWSITQRKSGNKWTTHDFYRYQLQIRDKNFSILHRSGRLFQQYVVDQVIF